MALFWLLLMLTSPQLIGPSGASFSSGWAVDIGSFPSVVVDKYWFPTKCTSAVFSYCCVFMDHTVESDIENNSSLVIYLRLNRNWRPRWDRFLLEIVLLRNGNSWGSPRFRFLIVSHPLASDVIHSVHPET